MCVQFPKVEDEKYTENKQVTAYGFAKLSNFILALSQRESAFQ